MRVPKYADARIIEQIRFDEGAFKGVLLGDIQPAGMVEYEYILEVYEKGAFEPCAYLTAEKNAMAALIGGGKFFLCEFSQGRHSNFGCSDSWGDLEVFKQAGSLYIEEKLCGFVERGSFNAFVDQHEYIVTDEDLLNFETFEEACDNKLNNSQKQEGGE